MWPFRRSTIGAATSARVTEAASDDRDAWLRDKEGVGPQGGGAGRDLPDHQRNRAVRKSRVEYDKAAVYGGVLDRFIDFVLGDGIVIKAKDERVDAWLQEQLAHGWYGRERRHVEALFVDGERLLVVRALARPNGPPIGALRIGTIDVLDIEATLVNQLDTEDVVALKVRQGLGDSLTLPVMREEEPAEPVRVTQADPKDPKAVRAMWVIGAFWRVNQRGARGVPVLLRTLDHASDLDNLVASLVAQLEYVRRIWLHATVAMADDTTADGKPGKFAKLAADIKAWATSMQAGEVLVTSGGEQGVKVNAVAPDMKLADAKALYDVVLEMCLGGHGIPKMWFGSGGETNRATAAEQGTPIFRAIQSRQAEVRANVESLVRALLTMGEAAGVSGVTIDAEVDVTMATVATRDSERDVREIAALGAALQIAIDRGSITDDEAAKILRDAVKSKTFGAKIEGAVPARPPAAKQAPTPPANAPEPPVARGGPARAAEALPAPPAPPQINVHVTTPHPPPAPPAPPQEPQAITINLPRAAPPKVRVKAGDVHVRVPEQAPPKVQVDVKVPDQPAPRVDVRVNVPESKPKRVRVERDSQGRIAGTVEEAPDA